MTTIQIDNTLISLSENFNMQEFYSPTLTKPNLPFQLPKCLLDAVQHLRTVWAVPIEITSVYRPNDTFGYHKTGNAVDFITYNDAPDYVSKFKTMCMNYKTSQLFKELRAIGVKGYGIENTCCHIDFREDSNCTLTDDKGKFCVFTWMPDGTPYGKSTII